MKTTKEILLKNILQELYQVPDKYLNGLYDIIRNLRTTLTNAENEKNDSSLTHESSDKSNFDWDQFISEVHKQRESENTTLNKKIERLFD
ncbi:MAG: hypothetical protein K8S16_21305 [Bacteroidales bacterium]|nr:hypothetical protein [Bacteroidales bacterium]